MLLYIKGENMNKILFFVGGTVNTLLAIFLFLFWKFLNWSETLSCLSQDNRSIMYCLNLHCSMLIVLFAYVSFFHNVDMLKSKTGRLLTGFIAFFYFQRAVEDIIFWGIDPVIFAICIITGVIYTLPLLPKIKGR